MALKKLVHDPRFPPLELPLFDGFPYLVTQVITNMHHCMLLPEDLQETDLVELGIKQTTANRLHSCVVISTDRAVYIEPDLTTTAGDTPPVGGMVVTGKLAQCWELPPSARTHLRQQQLSSYVESTNPGRYHTGDPGMDGREGSADELRRLTGTQPNGWPVGLKRCRACGEPRGRCLHQNPQFRGYVTHVRCLCENWNRCAACGRKLAYRRLNAPYFDEFRGRIQFVPGFVGLNHKCETRSILLFDLNGVTTSMTTRTEFEADDDEEDDGPDDYSLVASPPEPEELRTFSVKAFKHALDSALAPLDPQDPAGAQLLTPVGQVDMNEKLLEGIADEEDREIARDNCSAWDLMDRLSAKTLFGFETAGFTIVADAWSIDEFLIDGRGYLFSRSTDDFPPVLLGAWEPAEDMEARKQCLLSFYVQGWNEMAWPPYRCRITEGDTALLSECVFAACERAGTQDEWRFAASIVGEHDLPPAAELADEIAGMCSLPPDKVEEVLLRLETEDPSERFRTGAATVEERWVIATAFVYLHLHPRRM